MQFIPSATDNHVCQCGHINFRHKAVTVVGEFYTRAGGRCDEGGEGVMMRMSVVFSHNVPSDVLQTLHPNRISPVGYHSELSYPCLQPQQVGDGNGGDHNVVRVTLAVIPVCCSCVMFM